MKNEKKQMTSKEKAQLTGVISEMLNKATSYGDEQLEILQSTLNFCVGHNYLIIDQRIVLSLFAKNQ